MTTTTAYVSIDNTAARTEIADALSRDGWRVVQCPSGYHVIASLAGWLDDADASRPAIDLLVVAERSRGCRGTTIARGLRELGIATPIVLLDDETRHDAIANVMRVCSSIEPAALAHEIAARARELRARELAPPIDDSSSPSAPRFDAARSDELAPPIDDSSSTSAPRFDAARSSELAPPIDNSSSTSAPRFDAARSSDARFAPRPRSSDVAARFDIPHSRSSDLAVCSRSSEVAA